MPGKSVHELVELAVETYDETWEQEQAHISALRWRGTCDVLESMRLLSASDDSRRREIAAYVFGRTGRTISP